jgi:hypothetical protein
MIFIFNQLIVIHLTSRFSFLFLVLFRLNFVLNHLRFDIICLILVSEFFITKARKTFLLVLYLKMFTIKQI